MFNKALYQYFLQVETPFYFYDISLLHKSLDNLTRAAGKYDYHIHYAIKANANDRVLQIIKDYGLGADCVSGNEVKKAVEMGIPSEKVVFAGVGKSDAEIIYAIDQSIFSFNCESIEEIEVINEWGRKKQKVVPVSLRLNPDIDAITHKYLTTGLPENKFGIPLQFLDRVIRRVNSLSHIQLIGLHFHIGSQIRELAPYIELCEKVNSIQDIIYKKHGLLLEHINLGGGLGINYEDPDAEPIPDFEHFFDTIHEHLKVREGQKVHFELGRSVVGQMGSLISKVLYIKKGLNKEFMILDAGMTDLIRPALYGAQHKIQNISRPGAQIKNYKYDVVGPVCETSDSFDDDVMLPKTKRGDLVAIRSTGAYGEIMVSQYTLRNKPKAVYSDEIRTASGNPLVIDEIV
ncbi:diaminopimelate decarboxylase [Candidatus Sulfidibacterium hydrothermale]|uniref:diaminopimelate decarboxylase n=1 Tax=Candidatus Sulfidibacterium hydrothermale TaxID=2875962 RepID=UPI001F0A4572|nr:diaminopimelate decarboxylase [Candidatus Sulfidibacterium hydrothermale]UBM61986.1 diaminopimelate decarboxylase [Candidatus Sulfidibacterium hydrothermale]